MILGTIFLRLIDVDMKFMGRAEVHLPDHYHIVILEKVGNLSVELANLD
jgi:hypothetical protein